MATFKPQHYVREVAYQCAAFIRGFEVFLTSVAPEPPKRGDDIGRIVNRPFQDVQNLLGTAAQISKLMKPPIEKRWNRSRRHYALSRARILREITMTPESSIVLNRDVRNSVEHFDARMDDILITEPSGVVDQILSEGAGAFVGVPDDSIFRWINPKTLTVSVLGLTIDMGELHREVERIHETCQAWTMAHWLSHDSGNMDIGEPCP